MVDDDVRTARVLVRLLTEDGFEVELAADGAAAIARLSRSPLPELLVTDLHMPHADGVAVASYARTRVPGIPVFIVTGYPELAGGMRQRLAPLATVFSKPLAYPELTAAMRSSLQRG